MTGYVRVDTSNNIADGNVINAADLDNEFDGVQAAFNVSTGHTHGGAAGEGAPITKIGPTQDVTASSSLLAPKTTNTVDVGSSLLKFKDLYLAGNASIGGTLAITGVATFTAQPVLSSLTASKAVFSDGSKGLVSNDITGTGNVVMSNSPTLVTPALGTPSSVTLTNATGLPVASGISGLGTGVATFLATPSSSNLASAVSDETGTGALVFANSPTLVTPALGTPSSATLTNATGLPIATGVSGLGTGIATALAVNAGSAGAPVLFNDALGTPSSGTVTNLTGTASININGTVGATTPSTGAFTTLSASGTTTLSGNQIISVTDNTNAALRITQLGTGNALLVEDSTNPDSTPFVIDASGRVISGFATSRTTAVGEAQVQINGGTAPLSLIRQADSSTAINLEFAKARAAGAILNSSDTIGRLYFSGSDGTAQIPAAYIDAAVDGTPGVADMPGRLIFSTTADGESTPTERMRIDSAGQTKFSYNAVIEATNNTNAALRITQLGTGNALLVEDSTNPDATPTVIDNSGYLIVGHTSRLTTTNTGQIESVVTSAGNAFNAIRFSSGTSGAEFNFAKSDSDTIGTNTVVASGDTLGAMSWSGADGTNYIRAAQITAAVDGTPGTNDMPGRLVFSTTADGASTATERLRITSSGNVLVGTTTNPSGSGKISTTGGIVTRVNAQTTTTSPWAWNSDSYDQQEFTALANALTINADAGTPTDGQKTIFRLQDNGTARALTWTTGTSKSFRAIGVTLPTTTVIGKTMYVGCIYNSGDSRWDVVAVVQEV